MMLFGYSKKDAESLIELSEITLLASPEMLREISSFLNLCADEIQSKGDDWEHEHFETESSCAAEIPNIIVFNPNAA